MFFAMNHWFFLAEYLVVFSGLLQRISSQLVAEPKDYCRLTPERGPCRESQRRWYYDVKVDNCTQFVFGGCSGNQNNFDTFERCDLTCRRTRNSASTIGYMFASGIGPNLPDSQRRSSSSGVDDRGNTNVLLGTDSVDECDQPVQRGFCSSFIPRWHHNGSSCELFYFSGCGGNGNNFMTRESCLERCPSRTLGPFSSQTSSLRPLATSLIQSSCQLKPQRGSCRSALIRWYFDVPSQNCLEFVYSGCNGNENNHASEQECLQQCSRESLRRSGSASGRSLNPSKSDQNSLFPGAFEQQSPDLFADAGVKPSEVVVRTRAGDVGGFASTGSIPEKCIPEPERGPCTVDIERWYHDTVTKTCRPFYYGGCLGNSNRFSTRKECETSCSVSPAPRGMTPITDAQACVLEPATGPCRAAFTRYYFDVAAGQCKQFTYGGCEGNANNFQTLEDCESRCQTAARPDSFNQVRSSLIGLGPDTRSGNTGTGRTSRLGARCFLPSETGPCRAALPKFFFNGRFCSTFIYGGCAGNENNFDSVEECQAACGGEASLVPSLEPPSRSPPLGGSRNDGNLEPGLLAADACAQPPDSGPCNAVLTRFFSDPISGSCKPFTYGGCGGNLNNYKSHTECELTCPTRGPKVDNASLPAVCGLPAERGPCRAFIPAFFHDVRDGKCKMFYFGGCQGNENRFSSRQECEDVCSGKNSILDFQNQIPRELPPSILNPPQLSPDTKSCNEPAAPGPCLAMIPSYFFDPEMQQCRQFIYGGCGGNSNRFSAKEECENKCRPQLQARSGHSPTRKAITHTNADCLSPTETGPCRGRFKVFGFDAAQQTCVDFIYGGCNGNGNRFPTLSECNAQCGGLITSDNTNMLKMQQLRESAAANFGFQPAQQRRLR
ncbi:hypothetical protein RvY_13653 [Ramazzottius varieornatus]|uniref:BPTI/Kunitz inhibitor domain-containing protein n=1 Tax=Ramazzottius varieornatus TaxID=947166 RepID=A0A1D1VQF8_RAMVA|nr:hypothetical protein RvY_13653 [Ramazzottius varieornatus]